MINIVSKSEKFENNFIFTDYFQNKDNYYYLITSNFKNYNFLDEINDIILNKMIDIDFDEIKPNELEDFFQKIFLELNWQINAIYNQKEATDIGVSLLLIIVRKNTIYFIQFGRILCGFIKDLKLDSIGKKWDNFRVKSREDLFLLGGVPKDIFIEVKKLTLKNDDYFFCLPSKTSEKFEFNNLNSETLTNTLNKLYLEDKFPHLILQCKDFKSKNRKIRKRR